MEKQKETRKLTKNGSGTMYVSLPKEFVRNLKWRERQKLSVERVAGGILIKDNRGKK